MTERHTGTHLASTLEAIFEEFDLHSVVAMVTDNAANMVKCCEEDNLTRIRALHTLCSWE